MLAADACVKKHQQCAGHGDRHIGIACEHPRREPAEQHVPYDAAAERRYDCEKQHAEEIGSSLHRGHRAAYAEGDNAYDF